MNLHYKDIGKGKPVGLIHGFMENHKMWTFATNKLATNHRLIVPDMLGHGISDFDFDKITMEMQAHALKKLLDELNIQKISLIGHSMGGYIALAFAKLYPEYINGLCLFFSSPLADDEAKKKIRVKAADVVRKNKEKFIQLGIPNLFNSGKLKQLSSQITTAKLWAMETPVQGIVASSLGMADRADSTHILRDADYPIYVLAGTYDNAVNTEQLKAVLPQNKNISFHQLPIGHMGHLEAPEQCLEILNEFLAISHP